MVSPESSASVVTSISVSDKSTAEAIEELPIDDAAAVARAAAAARKAQTGWAALPPRQRAARLNRARKSLVAAARAIAFATA